MKKQNHNNPPHGSHVYEEPNCHCNHEVCKTKRESVENFVQSFGQIASDWIKILLKSFGEIDCAPMWGTCFIVGELCDLSSIERLFVDDSEDIEEEDLCPGWFPVGETGLLGRELDGNLILGIDGEGYDFYAHHWEPLYDALGYIWHRSPADASSAELAFVEDGE